MLFQEIPQLGLSLEEGTPRVPADGRYYVLLNGEVIADCASQKQALRAYQKKREELKAPLGEPKAAPADAAEMLRQETAYRNVQEILSASYSQRARKMLRKGGKGR